jgi:hypothetical protein
LGEISKHASFKDIVHHPATQAIGYAALAGEGIHLLEGKRGRLGRFYGSRTGKRFQKGTLGVGSAFLAAEALAALGDLVGKKRKKKAVKGPDVIIKMQAPDPKIPRVRLGKTPIPGLRKLTKSIGFKR